MSTAASFDWKLIETSERSLGQTQNLSPSQAQSFEAAWEQMTSDKVTFSIKSIEMKGTFYPKLMQIGGLPGYVFARVPKVVVHVDCPCRFLWWDDYGWQPFGESVNCQIQEALKNEAEVVYHVISGMVYKVDIVEMIWTNLKTNCQRGLLFKNWVNVKHSAINVPAFPEDFCWDMPNHFVCPISQSVFTDPVLAGDGNTYERELILRHMKNSDKSPLTNEKMPMVLISNNNLIKAMEEFLEKYKAATKMKLKKKM